VSAASSRVAAAAAAAAAAAVVAAAVAAAAAAAAAAAVWESTNRDVPRRSSGYPTLPHLPSPSGELHALPLLLHTYYVVLLLPLGERRALPELLTYLLFTHYLL